MKKIDARIVNTKNFLKRALLTLLSNKKLSQITVSNLCNAAEINRATFYFHYKDINQLFEEIVEEYMSETCKFITKINDSNASNRYEIFYNFIKYIDNNSDLFVLIFENSNNIEYSYDQYFTLQEKIFQRIETAHDKKTYAAYITNFYIYSGGAILYTWIKNGKKEDYNQLIKLMSSLIIRGASSYTSS